MNNRSISPEPSTPPTSPPFDLWREIRVEGQPMVRAHVWLPDSSDILEALPLSSSPSCIVSEGEEEECPYPWEVSLAAPGPKTSYLDPYLDRGVVIMAEPTDNEPCTSGRQVPEDGPGKYFVRPSFRQVMRREMKHWAISYHLKDPFLFYEPLAEGTVLNPSPGCIAVYERHLRMGLRFPLHPFIVELLNSFNLALHQLMPNTVASLVSLLSVCDTLGVTCTMRLFRNLMKIVEVPKEEHGRGWWSFQARRRYKVVGPLPTSQKYFRHEFVLVYRGDEWDIPRVASSEEPNFGLNLNVPEMSAEEAVAACYFQTIKGTKDGVSVELPQYWLPDKDNLSDEHFLSATGMSQAYPKGRPLFLTE